MNPIAIIHVIVGFVIIGVSLPLVKRKIKRNHWYGIRIPEAFKSEERWLEINQYGGHLMIRLGVVVLSDFVLNRTSPIHVKFAVHGLPARA
jgi:uncharacterized membrane protein